MKGMRPPRPPLPLAVNGDGRSECHVKECERIVRYCHLNARIGWSLVVHNGTVSWPNVKCDASARGLRFNYVASRRRIHRLVRLIVFGEFRSHYRQMDLIW